MSDRARVGERDYEAVAHETRQRIVWGRILQEHSTRSALWKWRQNARNFSIYTKDDGASFCVLAAGVVKGSVQEVASLLTSSSQDDFHEKMSAFCGKDLKSATYVADIPVRRDSDAPTRTHMSIRHVKYSTSGWLQRDDAWCYLDSTTFDPESQHFEKHITTLKPEDVLQTGKRRRSKFASSKTMQNVICGYSVQPNNSYEPDVAPTRLSHQGVSVRVHFYAELRVPQGSRNFRKPPVPSVKDDATTKAIKQRLLRVALGCDRISQLVRRRRLGVQVLVDTRRLVTLTNSSCANCDKVKFVGKRCRMCGQVVCSDCSEKYERETHKGSTRVDMVRVCDPCLVRIESADYSNVTASDLSGLTVVASTPVRNALKDLLQDALLRAPSPQRKGAVMSVIRSVLEEEGAALEKQRTKSISSTTDSVTSSADYEYISALDRMSSTLTPTVGVKVSGQDGRPYTLNPRCEGTYPVPANEATRIKLIDEIGILTMEKLDELDIICDIAAKEIGAMASIVSVITQDQQRIVGANNPLFRTMHMDRETSFCTHTIMDDKPLIVPHPEADYRMSHIARMSKMGVRFYCGFPLFGDDATVIGTLCCVDQKSHAMTESQYHAMQRLAQTASKIVRLEGEKRKRSLTSNHPGIST